MILSKKNKKREPLFFIQQPKIQSPQGKMQESFSARQAEKRRQEQLKLQRAEQDTVEAEKKKKVRRKKEEFSLPPEEVQKTIEDYEEKKAEENKNEYGLRRLKPFREMGTDERIDYLSNFPKRLPPVPCHFQTKDKGWKGTLLEKRGEEIIVRLFDMSEITIPLKDLTEVKMIGLN